MHQIEEYTSVPLFAGLEASEIAGLLESSEAVKASGGEVIIQQGEQGPGLYLVASGTFAVIKEGIETPVAYLEEYSHFGEMSLITNEPVSASVVCEREGRLRLLPWRRFGAMLRDRNPVAFTVVLNMSRVMARRLLRAEERFLLWSPESEDA